MPEMAVGHVESRDRGLAAAPADHAAIGKLAAAARIEWRTSEPDAALARLDDIACDRQGLGVLVTEEVDSSALRYYRADVLAKIVGRRFRRLLRARTAGA